MTCGIDFIIKNGVYSFPLDVRKHSTISIFLSVNKTPQILNKEWIADKVQDDLHSEYQ